MRSSWYTQAIQVIQQVDRRLSSTATEAERRKAYSEAYPFGERHYHPYKVWCQAVHEHLADLRRLLEWTGGEIR